MKTLACTHLLQLHARSAHRRNRIHVCACVPFEGGVACVVGAKVGVMHVSRVSMNTKAIKDNHFV